MPGDPAERPAPRPDECDHGCHHNAAGEFILDSSCPTHG
jgi:hypothetical protein